jgi:hypothetical protein
MKWDQNGSFEIPYFVTCIRRVRNEKLQKYAYTFAISVSLSVHASVRLVQL